MSYWSRAAIDAPGRISYDPAMQKVFYLVVGSKGEWSDREEWPVALLESEAMARQLAESAKRHAAAADARHHDWDREVLFPWYRANPHPGRRTNYDKHAFLAWEASMPKDPRHSNPFDPDPDHGDGDEYRVEAVPLLTDIPDENLGE